MLNKLFAAVAAWVTTLVGALTSPPKRVRAARGVTFIEYALLAALAVVIGGLFYTFLWPAFQGMLGNVKTKMGTPGK